MKGNAIINKNNKIVVIGGPTASGKSGLALDIAKVLNGAVINADSMQVYQGLPILSAVPSVEEQKQVPHRLYEIYAPSRRGTVVDWLELAAQEISNCHEKGGLPVVVGGTGLYLDNLINGSTPIPEPLAEVREDVSLLEAKIGLGALYSRWQEEDPHGAALVNANDKTRVRRGYEIWRQTKVSISEWYRRPLIKKFPQAEFIVIKIIPAAEELDKRCYLRFEQMIAAGALDEVRALLQLNLPPSLPAMKMLGVPELAAYLEGQSSLSEAVAAAQLHTRQYAKRQRTWFKNKLRADFTLEKCYCGGEDENIINDVKKVINCCTHGD